MPSKTNADLLLESSRLDGLGRNPATASFHLADDGPGITYNRVMHFGRDIGFTGETKHYDDRLSFTFSEEHNRDLLDGRRVLHDWQLDSARNWRRVARFDYAAPRNPAGLNFTMSGGILDTRRPVAVANPRLNLGYPARWAEVQAADVMIGLGLFGDQLRYEGAFGRSRYRGTVDYEEVKRRPDRWSTRATAGRGSAQRHRFDVDFLSGDQAEISAFGLYSSADPAFRGTGGFAVGDILELGASFSSDKFSFGITRLDRSGPGRSQRKLEGEFGYGAMTATLFQDSFTRGNQRGWRSREDTIGGSLGFGLENLRGSEGDFGPRRLLPSTVTLGAERGLIRYAGAPGEPGDVKTGLSLGLSWSWDGAFTDLSFYRAVTDSPTGSSLGMDQRDYGIDFSQSFYGDFWDLSGYVSLGGFDTNGSEFRTQDSWVLGGVAASYYPDRLPDISVAVDVDRFDGYYWDYPDFAERHGERSMRFDMSLDFSKFLNDGASMSLNYHALRENRSSDTGRSTDLQHAVSLTLGVRF